MWSNLWGFKSPYRHHKADWSSSPNLLYSLRVGLESPFGGFSGFADGRHEVSPDSEEIEQTGTKCRKRNFPSVEQIQDSGSELRLESFAKVEDLKHNSELPLNASDSRQSPYRQIILSRERSQAHFI